MHDNLSTPDAMLPGFNHNIRHKDRLFHVQTEDNGLVQHRLVTQIFLEGHVLALLKSSYEDLLVGAPDPKTRDDRIRVRMQDQHKKLMKNLVKGAYEERIAAYVSREELEPISPESLLAPDFLAEVSAAIQSETGSLPPPDLASDLVVLGPASAPERDFLAALDEEMRNHGAIIEAPSADMMMEFGLPAAVRAVAPPSRPPTSLEHSLDDVILSYLSDDVD